MILKKPYAFLIKYFRLIHLVLAIPVIYLAVKSASIVNFFNDYVNNHYSLTINGDLSTIFINPFMYLGVILIILSAIAVYWLFKYKEKPRKHYIAIIIYYLLLFILFTVCHNILEIMEHNVLEASLARAYRDISLILSIPQYYFCIFIVIRGLGFNVKKLNFADDLKELEISEKDSEEFEFVLGVEGYKAKRTVRRFFREFTYYIKENTFIFIAIILLAVIGIGTSIYLNREDYEVYYKQGEIFDYKTFAISIEDSITTNLAYNGNIINKDKYYLIVKLNVRNKFSSPQSLVYSNFRIKIGNDFLTPIIDKASYFSDYATPYKGDDIRALEENTYVLVYELTNEQLKGEYELKIYNSVTAKKDELRTRYSNVTLTPILIDQVSEVKGVGLGETLDLTNSNIGNTKLAIDGYQITNKYNYTYVNCYNNNCKNLNDYVALDYYAVGSGSTLLVLNYKLDLDKESIYSHYTKSEKTFFNNFASIEYKINNEYYKETIINKTPNNITDTLILQVTNKINDATELKLLITVRNKSYDIRLK